MVKKNYELKAKIRRSYTHAKTGKRYRKGEIVIKIISKKSAETMRRFHKDKIYASQQPYKLISIRKKLKKKK